MPRKEQKGNDADGSVEFEREPEQKEADAVDVVDEGDIKAVEGGEEAGAVEQDQDLGGDQQPSQEDIEAQAESPDQKDEQNAEPKVEESKQENEAGITDTAD